MWIIQDGNYPNLKAGQTAEFAVEFWIPDPAKIRPSDEELSATLVRDNLYDVVADVVAHAQQVFLDVGFLVYSQEGSRLPSPLSSRLALQLNLGVDPYFIFEALGESQEILRLVYTWRINAILRQTAPYIQPDETRNYWTRDVSRWGWEEIEETDAWNDDGGHADNILRCELLPFPAHRTSAAAIP